jgi:hypothetical protein
MLNVGWMRLGACTLALLAGVVGTAWGQTGNPLHDQIAGVDEPARRAELHRTITGTGAGCQAIIATYFAGLDQARTAYWDSRCREGSMYRMSLPAQRSGRPSLQVCGAAGGGIAAGPCFQPLGTAVAETAQAAGGTGIQLAGQSAAPPPGSRFGAAYGTDAPVAAFGFGNGSTDRLAVNTAAVRACQAMAGRIPCKFQGEIVNQCGAVAQAVTRHPQAVAMTSDISTVVLNRSFLATGTSQPAAEQAALEQCRRIPGVTCRIAASGC